MVDRTKEERDEDVAARGRAARVLLQDSVVIDLLRGMERSAVDSMVDAPVLDDDARRSAALIVKVLRDFRTQLEHIATEGQHAQLRIDNRRTIHD